MKEIKKCTQGDTAGLVPQFVLFNHFGTLPPTEEMLLWKLNHQKDITESSWRAAVVSCFNSA